MVFQTIEGSLTDLEFLSRIEALDETREEFLSEVNRVRWNNYQERDAVFGLEYGEEFPTDDWDLPYGDQFNIVQENANYAWAEALWNAIMTGDISKIQADERLSSWTASTDSLPAFEYRFMQLESGDYEFKDGLLSVYTPDEALVLEAELEEEIPEEIETIRVEYEDAPEIVVYYEYEGNSDNDSTIQDSLNRLQSEFSKTLQAAYSVATASGALEVTQIEAPKGDDEFVELFEELGLWYSKIMTKNGRDIFLITHSERGKDVIRAYEDFTDPSVADYLSMLGYPAEIKQFTVDGERKFDEEKYDRYPSEEFVAYLMEDGEVDSDLLWYISLCPYRPPPSKKQAKYAIQLGQQIEESVKEFCRLHDRLEVDEILTALENQQKTRDTSPVKPIFPSDCWPLDPHSGETNIDGNKNSVTGDDNINSDGATDEK